MANDENGFSKWAADRKLALEKWSEDQEHASDLRAKTNHDLSEHSKKLKAQSRAFEEEFRKPDAIEEKRLPYFSDEEPKVSSRSPLSVAKVARDLFGIEDRED